MFICLRHACISGLWNSSSAHGRGSEETVVERPEQAVAKRFGKSMVLTLPVEYFESVLGWSHGQEFGALISLTRL